MGLDYTKSINIAIYGVEVNRQPTRNAGTKLRLASMMGHPTTYCWIFSNQNGFSGLEGS